MKPLLAAVMVVWGWVGMVQAHALDPGYLQMQHLEGEAWQVFWRKPTVQGKPMEIDAVLPSNCSPRRSERDPQFDGAAWVSQWLTLCPAGLAGHPIVIEGLEATQTDVLVRLTGPDGQVLSKRLTADETGFTVPAEMTGWDVFASYVALGFDHILEGFDHLLFVFALLVLIRDPWRLVGAVTAFTVAHSITLALATLDVIRVPSPPVEAVIALSIVLLAVEILRRRQGGDQLTERYPWLLSFGFGLLHGLGFAGALSEIGLPQGEIPLALLAFNIGVEAGQLAFVAVILLAFAALRWLAPRTAVVLRDPASHGTLVMGYAIGGVATFWLAERVAGF
ncbi:HupE / UreJ protein [Falsiruegeria litorea R37]|uniref:HupE / UreJ protein n=1 Tax=Falsiruegeria litorea R37 TaxID=1200284 RepID=A0A1Y5SUH5_9RHOB|nr:HupE/UreJ family protein [Falsiruegeria litorea]SLN48728.1 HupE / UreJ protein [Falsiruegeria litorea R37]